MKNLKQLVLPCYKMEVAMNVEAWYFLHGTTNGVCNLTYFLSLLSGMAVTKVSKTKRGLDYVLHPGQVDGSMLSLAKEWNIGRKSVSRLLEDFSQRGLIRVVSNPITTIIDMVCVKSWMMDGRLTENPTYQQTVKAYEGVRIYLFNGQRMETLRKSSARMKKSKDKDMGKDKEKSAQASQLGQSTSEDEEHSKQSENNPLIMQKGDTLSDDNTSYK
ncbi:hypothetical protein [Alistipes sp. An116]|uniref:hypothetical protein n=1 Tax=Alistipes sp. An116 TaxID=1965546 RepID=UPI001EF614F1|nr:hypothetical protein [Alistipes sp. An116]